MKPYTIHKIIREFENRFINDGFSKMDNIQYNKIDGAYHKRNFQITKFSIVDTFYMIHFADNEISIQNIKSISKRMFKIALKNKMWIPRSLGNGVFLFSVFILNNPSSEIKQFFNSYDPKHYASFEFPVLIDMASNEINFCQYTPMWGLVYYRGMRNTATKMLSFH